MKTIIAAVVTCVLLFGASYAASVYFAQQAAAASDEEAPEEQQDDTSEESDILPEGGTAEKTNLPMQVPNNSAQSVSIEAVLQMSDSIRKREAQVDLREKQALDNEKRVEMLFADLESERDSLRTLNDNVDSKLLQLQRVTDDLNAKLATLETRRAEVNKLEKEVGVDDVSKQEDLENRVNDVKGWFENLAPEQASDYIKKFANNGKLEFAASLLQKMPNRQKSKILGALSDPVLVEQLIDELVVKPKQQ
jgi:hypothetical protein